MMVAFGAQAQVVQVMKDGKVIKEYPASQVRSVEYKPVYYYYAGWECPKNEAELAKLAVEPNGGLVDMTKTYTADVPLVDFGKVDIYVDEAEYYYMVIPNTMSIYNSIGTDVSNGSLKPYTSISIPNHSVYRTAIKEDTIGPFRIYNK